MKKKKKEITLDILARMMATGFERIEARFVGMDKRLDGLEARLDGLEARFDKLEIRFNRLEARFDVLEARLDGLESELRAFKVETREAFERLESRIFPNPMDREDLEARVSYIEKKLKIKSGR